MNYMNTGRSAIENYINKHLKNKRNNLLDPLPKKFETIYQ